MAGVAQAYQQLIRRVAVCIVEIFIRQVTPFIALIHLSFIQ